jgi:hypothetical protein
MEILREVVLSIVWFLLTHPMIMPIEKIPYGNKIK